jgi:hypothetical protein
MAGNMSTNTSPRSPFAGFALFAMLVALASIVLPMIFGRAMTISPLLLLAIAVIPNFIACLIPATDENGGHALFSRIFYLRLISSIVAALLLLAIERIAHAVS